MDVKRLLPEGAHVVFLPLFATFMPYDPSECTPAFLKKSLHRLRGDLDGVVVPRNQVAVLAELFRRTPETVLREIRTDIKAHMTEALEGEGLESLYPVSEEYHGDVGDVTMTKAEVQSEIDVLRQEHQFELPIEVKLMEPDEESAGQTVVLGMPFSSRPHSITVAFPLHTLKLAKRSIRYAIRHEFAHCLAVTRAWEEEFLSSANHTGAEWNKACEELGIVPDPNGPPHETGYYRCYCPECEFEGCQLRFENDEGYEPYCDDCGALLESERIDQILYLTANQTYAVEEDGRLTPIALPPDDFFGLVPEFFDD